MKSSITALSALAVGALVAGVLGGCAPAAEPDGPAQLEFWTFLDPDGTDPRGAALKSIVESFNDEHDDIEVTVRSIHFSKIDAEIIRATASGSGPDITNIPTKQLAAHIDAGTLAPLDDFAGDWLAEWEDDLIFPLDGMRDGADALMAIPWETRGWVLWYRADLLKEAGVEVPTSLDELRTSAAAVREYYDNKVTGLAVGFSAEGLGADYIEKYIPFTWAFGGEVLDGDGKAAFNGDGGVKALEYIASLRESGAFGDEVLNMTADDVVNGIKTGNIAMAIEGTFRVAAARAGDGVGANLQTAPIPGVSGNAPTPAVGQSLAIGVNTEYSEQAWEFIQWYLSPESQLKFAPAGVLPVLSSVYDSDEIAALDNAEELRGWRDYVLNDGKGNPSSVDYNQLSDLLVKAGQKAVFHDADPQEELDKAATAFDQLH